MAAAAIEKAQLAELSGSKEEEDALKKRHKKERKEREAKEEKARQAEEEKNKKLKEGGADAAVVAKQNLKPKK